MKKMPRLAMVFWLALAGAASSGQTLDSSAVAPADSNGALAGPSGISEAPAKADSADESNFLELFYYGPDDDYYDVYDLWDLLPDREGDIRDSQPEEREGQERDARD